MIPNKLNDGCLLKATGVAALALLISSALMTLSAIESSVWFSFSNFKGKFRMKLIACDDCPSLRSTWTTACFAAAECDEDSGSHSCSQWKKANLAGTALYYLSYFTTLCTVLLIERVLFSLLSKYTGSKLVGYCLITASVIVHVVSILQWFAIMQAKFDGSCSSDDEVIDFCAEAGSTLFICAVSLNLLGCIATTLYIKKSNTADNLPSSSKIEGRRHFVMTKMIPLLVISLFFELFSVNWNWTYFSEFGEKHHNSATAIDSYDGIENYGFNCIAAPACDAEYKVTSTDRECNAFERLYDAGEILRKMKTIEFVFVVLWGEGIFYVCKNKQFGVAVLQYIWPTSMIIAQVISLGSWAINSGAAFSNNCQVLQLDHDIEFCSDLSVVFAIIAIISNGFATASFIIVYYSRYEFMQEDEVAETPSQKQKIFEKNQFTQDGLETSLERTSSLISSVFNDSTQGPDSRAVTPIIRGRTPSILAIEARPLSKRIEPDTNCSLCSRK